MNRAFLEQQAGFLLSLYTLLLRSADLISIRLTPILNATGSSWTYADKKNLNLIKDGMAKIKIGTEYFEEFMIEHGRTKSGSTNKVELYDALSNDANDFARINIDLFNARINNVENQFKIENLLRQYVGLKPPINDEIRESFRLKIYD